MSVVELLSTSSFTFTLEAVKKSNLSEISVTSDSAANLVDISQLPVTVWQIWLTFLSYQWQCGKSGWHFAVTVTVQLIWLTFLHYQWQCGKSGWHFPVTNNSVAFFLPTSTIYFMIFSRSPAWCLQDMLMQSTGIKVPSYSWLAFSRSLFWWLQYLILKAICILKSPLPGKSLKP